MNKTINPEEIYNTNNQEVIDNNEISSISGKNTTNKNEQYKELIEKSLSEPEKLSEEEQFEISQMPVELYSSLINELFIDYFEKNQDSNYKISDFNKAEISELTQFEKIEKIRDMMKGNLNELLDNINEDNAESINAFIDRLRDEKLSASKILKYFLYKIGDVGMGVAGVLTGTYDTAKNFYQASAKYWETAIEEIEVTKKTINKNIEKMKVPINSVKFAGMLLAPWNWLSMKNVNVIVDHILNKENDTLMGAFADEFLADDIESKGKNTIEDALNINNKNQAILEEQEAIEKRNEVLAQGNEKMKKSYTGLKKIIQSIWRIIKF